MVYRISVSDAMIVSLYQTFIASLLIPYCSPQRFMNMTENYMVIIMSDGHSNDKPNAIQITHHVPKFLHGNNANVYNIVIS